MRRIVLVVFALIAVLNGIEAKSLKGQKFDFVCQDSAFRDAFVDVDEWRKTPVRHRYVHGGFRSNGTRFSFYFPEQKQYEGRFFQYITPFPDSETSSQADQSPTSMIAFAIQHGAYFVETNEGGAIDFTNVQQGDPTIGAYRANAACAEFSRVLAQQLLGGGRPYGYCFGGSGGAYRTVGGIEQTEGVWDGAVPFVMGSPMAIPNVFSVRMNALRVLKDKLPDIVDALDAGGSGNPYETLTVEQRQVLQETSRMGFPLQSWEGYKWMDAHGFLVLYKSVVMADPTYFHEDFWNKPGYAGYEAPQSLKDARVQLVTTIKGIIGQDEGERLGLVTPMRPEERGSADAAWKSMGRGEGEKPVAYALNVNVPDIGLGGDLVILSGEAKGQVIQITKSKDNAVALAPTNALQLLAQVKTGDSVRVDNSDFLAVQTYYRHQVPTEDYYVWNQFRDHTGQPIYPQRQMLLGPGFTYSAAGCLPSGNIKSKVILVCCTWDREAFPWQGDWYRHKVEEHLGKKTDDNFRLWYIDRSTHGGLDDMTQVVNYGGALTQTLLDLSAWVERGIAPSPTTGYEIREGQVVLSDAAHRGGIQPIPVATIDGQKRKEVKTGETVRIHVAVSVPEGQGKLIATEWSTGLKQEFDRTLDMSTVSYNGSRAEFDIETSYDAPGTYFVSIKTISERNGNTNAIHNRIENIDRVRIVVK